MPSQHANWLTSTSRLQQKPCQQDQDFTTSTQDDGKTQTAHGVMSLQPLHTHSLNAQGYDRNDLKVRHETNLPDINVPL